ncbi:MAG TPA: pyruvate carboxylase [Phycisphaerae bacterium]|nr:pyruvate carboxylase [Phycisphaerae bacterium]
MKKLLVANRSEIAIRVMRAATELGFRTVAIYSHEDRYSLHRFKADEAYQVGGPDAPVKNYLNIPAIIQIAKDTGVEFIHPGYGFLSENAEFAEACADAGITFVGPTPEMLRGFGDKTAARKIAEKAGVPIVPGTEESISEWKDVHREAKRIGFPLIIKAAHGGGGRGMRVVREMSELQEKLTEASREAGAAFGKGEVFLERYIQRAKHIEVQLLGDSHGNLLHLFERDCTVQRRHQKVVELAPAVSLPMEVRQQICEAALKIGRQVHYRNAGTVEFLVDGETNEFFFIEVNPRIQVEHTVTEIITGVDLVKSQIRVAQGYNLHESPMNLPQQEDLAFRGVALQSRITSEDAANNFIPDYGRITSYRSPAGYGVRLDGGTAYSGAVITPHFDSLLVKLTCFGSTFEEVIARTQRALAEFRIRGVKTNIPFLQNLVAHPDFQTGKATTTFIDTTPALFKFPQRRDRATKLLTYIGDVIVNGRPEIKRKPDVSLMTPPPVLPAGRIDQIPPGTRNKLKELGPKKFGEWILKQKPLLITDTTMRDAHQSLLATRVRTIDMLNAAPFIAHHLPELFSLEMWGGATFDTSLRFLSEDPWERLEKLRKDVPNVLFQMLFRASNALGYTNYPDNVVKEFAKLAAAQGIDVFRIFDSLNWTENMKVAMEAVLETDAICEAAICYTGDILDPKRDKYSLKYYVKLAKELERMGTHILAIKDMAGLLKPLAARKLVKALREEVGVPIHFHTHDTAGIQGGAYLMAAEAGVNIVDCAVSSMSGMTSQPNMNALAAALRNTPRDTHLSDKALSDYSDYWEAVRRYYAPFEEGMLAPTASVYQHEMPGGQYTNLRVQAKSLGLESRWNDVANMYAEVNRLFGDIVKVTPSSKIVGDMALFMVTNNLKPADVMDPNRHLAFPKSVVEFFRGDIGQPTGGFPKELQKVVLGKEKPIKGRPGASLPKVNLEKTREELSEKIHHEASECDLASYLMYPQVFLEFDRFRKHYGDVAMIPTAVFFHGLQPYQEIPIEIEPGKTILVRFLTMGDPDADGMVTVFFELNGQPREVKVPDRKRAVTKIERPKADAMNPGHVGAPMPGKITAVNVSLGQSIQKGTKLLSIEAMKMESAVYSPREGKVAKIDVQPGNLVAAGDLLVEIE